MYKETEGILITIYKDVQENNQNVNEKNNSRTIIPNILWSYYDRISIKKVKEMREYLFSQKTPEFVGNVQSFHLYRKIEDKNARVFDYDRGDTQKALLVSGEKKWTYFALTLIRLNDEITDYVQNYDTRGAFNLSEIAGDISKCIRNKMRFEDDMAFEIYNSLGSEDFVIVMASNYLNSIRNVIEAIRKIQFESSPSEKAYLIEATHTIAGINCAKEIAAGYREEGVRASIRLTLKNTEEGELYWKEFKNSLSENVCQVEEQKKGYQLFGAHDVEIDIPIDQNFLRLYEETGCLNAENPKYKEALYQSQTIIYFEEKGKVSKWFLNKELNDDILWRIEQIEQRKPQTPSKYDDLKEAIERIGIMDDKSAFGVEMRIFFSEYEQNINSVFSKPWHNELNVQMRTFIDNLNKYITYIEDNKKETRNYLMRTIVECIESMKETYEHIAGGSRGVIDNARPISYYSGSYNNILLAYYGIIRTILSIGYIIPKAQIEKQHEVVFGVNFNIATRICSKMCFVMDDESKKDVEKSLVIFDLPYDALVDIPKYIPHLIHEVFHYILPVNRVNRNKLLYRIALDMSINETLKNLILHYMIEEDKQGELNFADGEIDKFVILWNHQIFDEKIHDLIEQTINNDRILFKKQSVFFYEKMEEICQCVESDGLLSIVSSVICDIREQNENPVSYYSDEIREYVEKNIENKNEVAYLRDTYVRAINVLYEDVHELKEKRRMQEKEENGNKSKNIYSNMLNRINYKMRTNPNAKFLKQSRLALYDGFSEAICDIYIFNLLSISFIEYLELLIPLLDTYCLNSWKKEYLLSLNPLIVRLGVLIDAYGEGDKREWLEKILDEWEKKTEVEDKETYVDVIKYYYEKYLARYGIYREMLIQYLSKLSLDEIYYNIQNVYSENPELIERWKNNLSYLQGLYKRSKSEVSGLYSLNIEIIESFRYQRSLSEIVQWVRKALNDYSGQFIEDIPFEVSEKSEKIHPKKIYLVDTAAGIGDYLDIVSEKIKSFNAAEENNQVWFRGVCNADYDVRASIFRSLPDNYSLYSYMVENIKKMHERTASYPEFWKSRSEMISQIACLQHYGCPTNFMDCSLDPLTSLYFAVNPDKEEDRARECDAVVYLIHPIIFNEEMDKLYERDLYGKLYSVYCANVLNESAYEDYVPMNFSDAYVNQKNKDYQDHCVEKKSLEYSHMLPPRTLIIPQDNKRIRAQLGTFIVYPLNMWPDNVSSTANKNDRFEYGCLKKMQEQVMDKNKNARKFIDKVVIRSESIPKIREQLKNFGIRKSRMYPDLPEIIKEIPESYKIKS